MTKEKVMYIQLPDGANYRRTEVTGDGRVAVFYKNCVFSKKTSKTTGSIPKPKPLIGGTEVYQKENGTSYWYCRIKDGRDEFMYVYFGDLTEKDLIYDSNGNKRYFTTKGLIFKNYVKEALKNKPKEGYSWIPVYEPSKNSKGNLCYVPGKEVLLELNAYEWEKKFEEYSPENGSREASITTYFLLALRWLKDGEATLEQLANDPRDIGHFRNSYNAKNELENTGEREFGGIYGFIGNTYKIVKNPKSCTGFSYVGGHHSEIGYHASLAYVAPVFFPNNTINLGVGLLELKK